MFAPLILVQVRGTRHPSHLKKGISPCCLTDSCWHRMNIEDSSGQGSEAGRKKRQATSGYFAMNLRGPLHANERRTLGDMLKERSAARGVQISRNQLLMELLFKEHLEVSARLAKLEGKESAPTSQNVPSQKIARPKRVRRPTMRGTP